MKSAPRPTCSIPITATAWSTWSSQRESVGACGSTTNAIAIIPSTPPLRREPLELPVREVPRMVDDGAAAGVRDREGDVRCQDVAPRLLGCVRQIEHDAELAEATDERLSPVGQPLRRRLDPTRELVREVPRQARHAHAAPVPVLEGLGGAFERLQALHREHETQARVVEVGARADLADALGVLGDRASELGLLGEGEVARLGARRGRRIERADLDADAARLELRQPVPLEQALRAVAEDGHDGFRPAVAHDELEQQVAVGIDDHAIPTYRA